MSLEYTKCMENMDMIVRFNEKVSIPEKCLRCPALLDLAKLHDSESKNASDMAEYIVGGKIEDNLLRRLTGEGVSEESIRDMLEQHRDSIRGLNIKLIDALDERLEGAASLGRKMVDMCPPEGILRMRAKRSGQQVLVTLCMSAFINEAATIDGIGTEPVGIQRTILEE